MATFTLANGIEYYYEIHGSGNETIIFAHGLLWSGKMFHKQVDAFKGNFRVITFDFRGQGGSSIAMLGYDMDTLAKDSAEIIEKLCPNGCHFAGLSMGGFIGMRLAARRPELINSLILMETSAEPEPAENIQKYNVLNKIVKYVGVWAVVKSVMPIMFGQKFLKDKARKNERKYWEAQLKANDRTGITRATEGVIRRQGVLDELASITCPTLIMVGTQDVATVPAKAEKIHAHIAGSRLVYIEGAGHTASVEEPEQINQVIRQFLGL